MRYVLLRGNIDCDVEAWVSDLTIEIRVRPMFFRVTCINLGGDRFAELSQVCHAFNAKVSVLQAISALTLHLHTDIDNILGQHGYRRHKSVGPAAATTIWHYQQDC
jgi:hypothetical protein